MSLRVLLADESDTIKKVFQLALQDLNAEIKSVQSGLDVIDVAQTYKPDIIFADVLLQKKNGYDTCREIKQNAALGKIPVVLMWSSFMELDQDQYKKSNADAQLEKPFDADFLRDLIKKFVPSLAPNPLDKFLSFPKSISAGLKNPPTGTGTANKTLKEKGLDEEASEFNFGLSNSKIIAPPPEALPEEPLMDLPSFGSKTDSESKDDAWLSADLSKFKIDADSGADNLDKFEALNLGKSASAPPPLEALQEIPTVPEEKDEDTDDISISALDKILEPEPSHSTNTATRGRNSDTDTSVRSSSRKVPTEGMSTSEIEAIVRAHTEEVIKTQITDSLLIIIEKIVRDELSKVLEEEVRLKQDLSGDGP